MAIGVVGISAAENARFTAFYSSLSGMQRPEGTISMFSTSAVISENRNKITEQFLQTDAQWVLYLDDDHILQPHTLMELLAADKDCISALYCQRQQPFNPVLMDTELPDRSFTWKQLHPQESGIISVAAAGAGCLLVKRKVIEALSPPYWTLGQINPTSWGDDLDFCSRVRKAGFEVHCDLNNYIGHIMTGVLFPRHEPQLGWTANLIQTMNTGIMAKFPMPLPGDN
jgi:hypothetical protein